MWGEDKRTPESRKKGDKAPIFTSIRRNINQMNRDEWKAWYKQCLDELIKDETIWNWLVRERGNISKPQILRTGKQGRPSNRNLQDLPDTRNTNHEI